MLFVLTSNAAAIIYGTGVYINSGHLLTAIWIMDISCPAFKFRRLADRTSVSCFVQVTKKKRLQPEIISRRYPRLETVVFDGEFRRWRRRWSVSRWRRDYCVAAALPTFCWRCPSTGGDSQTWTPWTVPALQPQPPTSWTDCHCPPWCMVSTFPARLLQTAPCPLPGFFRGPPSL